MKGILVYAGAFLIGLLSIGAGFYLLPLYKLPAWYRSSFGLIFCYFSYMILGIPTVTLYLRWLLHDSWRAALAKSVVTAVLNFIVIMAVYFITRTG